eukprot:TRINITY_DN17499_c0_g1_i1.p1 TRINITY_DN17499_c0_g1~~TRINITY_DN17499_c0_g1_i1.p1  ORF type:complete len:405 (+),score=132.54 TRINITY_DN17499_c0_g1_i1:49-1263(+)
MATTVMPQGIGAVCEGVNGMSLTTPSTAPSMSPNTMPSDAFAGEQSFAVSEMELEGRHQDPNAKIDEGHPPDAPEEEEAWSDEENAMHAHAAVSPLSSPVTDAVRDTLDAIAADDSPRVVLAASCGWTTALSTEALRMLCQTTNTVELILVDMLNDAIITNACAALINTPSVRSLVMVNSRSCDGVSLDAMSHICSLLYSSKTFESLSLMNCLHAIAPQAIQLLGGAIVYSRSLRSLNLESNAIHDQDFLPLAQGLAEQRSLVSVCLDNNRLSYHGLDMMAEVMGYSETLQEVSLGGNLVRCVTDLWEGFYIMEQCKVNREMALLGRYTMERHEQWPSLWRRKMRKMWYYFKLLHGQGKLDAPETWESVMQWLDPRGYVEQKVKLWMKMEPPQQQAAQPVWRHT